MTQLRIRMLPAFIYFFRTEMQNDAMSKIKDSVFYRYQVSNDRKSMLAIKSLIPST
jgi:hypothetical protein